MIGVIIPSKFESKIVTTPHFISGMGKVRAVSAVYSMKNVDTILMAGFCGGLRGCKVGDVLSAHITVDGDYDARPLEDYPSSILTRSISKYTSAAFVSQDRFLTKDIYKNLLQSEQVMATDMESYGAAYACHRLSIPFYCIKIVSDIVGQNTSLDFLKSCNRLASKLNSVIDESISLIETS